MRRTLGVVALFAFAMILPGSGYAEKPDPVAQCQSKKVNAATIFVKKLFYIQAASLKSDVFDMDGALMEAEAQFEERWNAAEASDRCDFSWGQEIEVVGDEASPVSFADVGELMDWIEEQVEDIAGLIVAAVDTTDQKSVNLGAAILRNAGQKAFSLLKAEAQYLNQPNDAKKSRQRERAMRSYENGYNKRLQKALAQGAQVSAFTQDLLSDTEDEIDYLVDDIVTIFTAQAQT